MDSGVTKRFSAELFAQNDEAARRVVSEYLTTLGYTVIANPDKYGVDLLAQLGDTIWGVEVEVKRVWTGPRLPWSSVQLPARKLKYRNTRYPIVYVILNNEMTHFLSFPEGVLDTLKPVEVQNKYVRSREMFYQIPLSECDIVNMTGVPE